MISLKWCSGDGVLRQRHDEQLTANPVVHQVAGKANMGQDPPHNFTTVAKAAAPGFVLGRLVAVFLRIVTQLTISPIAEAPLLK
jgi:hypothetical protein